MNSQLVQTKEVFGESIGHPSSLTESYYSERYSSSGDEHDVDEVGGQSEEVSVSAETLTPDTSTGPSPDKDSSDSSSEFVTLSLDEIHVEDSYWPRSKFDPFTVDRYRDVILTRDEFPPLVVSDINGKWTVLDGVHRLQAYQSAREVACKKAAGSDTEDSATQVDDYRIRCRVSTVPADEEPIIYSCNLNRKHGKALSREDYKKVAEQLYRKNYGAPINKLAAQIHLDPKTFNKHVAPLVTQYKEEREAKRLQLKEKKLSDREIGQELKKEYPSGKGLSGSSINIAEKIKEKKVASAKAFQKDSGSAKPNVEIVNPAPSLINAKTGPSKFSKNSADIKILFGNRFHVITIRNMDFLRDELREELEEGVKTLVEKIRTRELLLREKEAERKAKRDLTKFNLAAA